MFCTLTFLLFFLTTSWLLFRTLNFYINSIHLPLFWLTVRNSGFHLLLLGLCQAMQTLSQSMKPELWPYAETKFYFSHGNTMWLTQSQTKGMYKADNLFLRLMWFSAPGQLPQSFGHWSPVIQSPPRCCRQPSSSHNNSSVKKRNQTRKELFIRTTNLSTLKLGMEHVTTIEWCNRVSSEI